jgi:hypothetical protein
VQYVEHLAPWLQGIGDENKQNRPLGDWFMVWLEDTPVLRRMTDLWVRRQLDALTEEQLWFTGFRLVFQLPWVAGVQIGDQEEFNRLMNQLRELLEMVKGTSDPLKPAHRGITISQIRYKVLDNAAKEVNQHLGPGEEPITPSLYHAQIDGAWYITPSQETLKGLIDRTVARREGKQPATKGERVAVNSALYLAPAALAKGQDAVRFYLEWESHRRALSNGPIWHSLYRGGLVSESMPLQAREGVALRYFGFVPVSPDDAAYAFDPKTDDVKNGRHGSLRQPRLHPGVEDASPLGQLLQQFRTVRADLRFREDGVHTVLTIARKRATP